MSTLSEEEMGSLRGETRPRVPRLAAQPRSYHRVQAEPQNPRVGRGSEGVGGGVGEGLTIILVFHPRASDAPFRSFAEAQEKGAGDRLLQESAFLAPAHEAHDVPGADGATVRPQGPCPACVDVGTGTGPGFCHAQTFSS